MTGPGSSPRPAPASDATLEAASYSDAETYARERRAIFAASWQFAGHQSALGSPGSWIACTIAGFPILVLRDEGGGLKGFHNVCRHRAGPLTKGAAGQCDGALVCQYHGWRYAYDGRLKSARDFGAASDFDPRDFHLFPIQVDVWRGLIFVRLDAGLEPLSSWAAPLEERLGHRDWSEYQVAHTRAHRLRCNWKTYVENYLEGYHVPILHPSLDAEIDSARYLVTMEGYVALHEAPLRNPDGVYDGLWAWLWPNLGLNVYGGDDGVMVERIVPLGVGATCLDYVYLTPGGAPVRPETLAMSDAVLAEDVWVVEQVQANLDAGVYRSGRLSPRHEQGVGVFQMLIRQALKAGHPGLS